MTEQAGGCPLGLKPSKRGAVNYQGFLVVFKSILSKNSYIPLASVSLTKIHASSSTTVWVLNLVLLRNLSS